MENLKLMIRSGGQPIVVDFGLLLVSEIGMDADGDLVLPGSGEKTLYVCLGIANETVHPLMVIVDDVGLYSAYLLGGVATDVEIADFDAEVFERVVHHDLDSGNDPLVQMRVRTALERK